jgi:hypothetical protein
MSDSDDSLNLILQQDRLIYKLSKEIAELKERIKELEEGSCRMPFC